MSFPSTFFFPLPVQQSVVQPPAQAHPLLQTASIPPHYHFNIILIRKQKESEKVGILHISRQDTTYVCNYQNTDTGAHFQWTCSETFLPEYFNLFFRMIFADQIPPTHIQFDCCMLPSTTIPVINNREMCENIVKSIYTMIQSFNVLGWPTRM